ncbi:MAG: flagellar type III secretion system pore protein FliP [Lachnospiraceae bacterium]|nr:flagellar type III secretion system pore protein FliP [Lachnospiraceae bacterium]MDE6743135.1 flagellar type III secretion system pore protein FliP [Lachnospiraceae bacterium]
MKSTKNYKRILHPICLLFLVGILCLLVPMRVYATDTDNDGETDERTYEDEPGTAETGRDNADLNVGDSFTITVDQGNGSLNGALRILIILTMISLAPMLLIMLTSFTRIIIVLHFTRTALNTQTAPPNQVLLGLAVFLTIYIMTPVFAQIYNDAIQPLDEGRITQEEALEAGLAPLREFMCGQTLVKDTATLMEIAGLEWDGVTTDDVPTTVLIPSFILGELRQAFIIGFVIYIPFLVIDMVVASILMSMGMMMLPPTTISMPFKILLFVLADGWNLIIVNLVKTFY